MHFLNGCRRLPITFIVYKYWSFYIARSVDLEFSVCCKIKIYNCIPVSLRPASGSPFPFAQEYWDRESCVVLFASAVILAKVRIQILLVLPTQMVITFFLVIKWKGESHNTF